MKTEQVNIRMRSLVWRTFRRIPRRAIPYILGIALAQSTQTLLEIFAIRYFAATLLEGTAPQVWMYLLYAVLGFAIVLVMKWSQVLLAPHFTALRLEQMRKVGHKILTMDMKHYENATMMGRASSAFRCLQSSDHGLEGLYRKTSNLVGDLAAYAVLLWVITRLNWILFPIFLIHLLLQFGIQTKESQIEIWAREAFQMPLKNLNQLASLSADFKYGKDIRFYGYGQVLLKALRDYSQTLLNLGFTKIRKRSTYLFLSLILLLIADACGLLVVLHQLLETRDTSNVVFALAALGLLHVKALGITDKLSFVTKTFRDIQHSEDFLALDLVEGSSEVRHPFHQAPSIVFDHVSFTYPNGTKPVFTDLCLEIQAGEKLALVGVNGAGKSTLIKLLSGLYRPDGGRILIDGLDYCQFAKEDLIRLIAVVFQENEVISGTVAENIACDSTFDEARVWEVLAAVDLTDRIQREEKGIHSLLLKVESKEGLILSGGELQKLNLARSLYPGERYVLILDEPTAALDALAEERLYQEFSSLMEGQTSILISHRLASTRFCDRIVLLDGGKIVATGRHEDLLQQEGLYRDMFDKQRAAYEEELP